MIRGSKTFSPYVFADISPIESYVNCTYALTRKDLRAPGQIRGIPTPINAEEEALLLYFRSFQIEPSKMTQNEAKLQSNCSKVRNHTASASNRTHIFNIALQNAFCALQAQRGRVSDYLEAPQGRLDTLLDVEQLTPRLIRIMGGKTGLMRLQGTNTYSWVRGSIDYLLIPAKVFANGSTV